MLAVAACLASTCFAAAALTPVERLRELDRLLAEGLISETTYKAEWRKIIDEGINPPPENAAAVPAPRAQRAKNALKRFELTGSGLWADLDAGEVDMRLLQGNVSLGYFVTSHLELIGSAGYLSLEVEELQADALMLGAGIDFHLTTKGPVVPYVGAGASWGRVDLEGFGDEDDWVWNVHAGIKQPVGESTAVRYEVGYLSFDELDLDGVVVSIGLSFVF